MDKENLDYLKDQVKYMGFGEKLHPQLEQQLQTAGKEFKLEYTRGQGEDKVEALLHFKRSDSSERAFFNSYEVKLRDNGEDRQHSFSLNKGKGVTLLEAENLLHGRSVYKELVNKENQPYKAWLQLDRENKQENGNYTLKQYHDNYGFNLEKTIQQLPVRLENEESKEKMQKALQKGNVVLATFSENGQERKVHLEAAPQFKNIVVYDQNMKREFQQHREQSQSQQREEKQEQKLDQRKERAPRNEESHEEKKRSQGRSQSR